MRQNMPARPFVRIQISACSMNWIRSHFALIFFLKKVRFSVSAKQACNGILYCLSQILVP